MQTDETSTAGLGGLSRFEQLTRDIQVDEWSRRQVEATVAQAKRRYVVLFSPRSGSTWLTEVLSSTGRLGFPEEFINPDFIPDIARFLNAKTADHFLDALLRRRKSSNGVFGIETIAQYVDIFGFESFSTFFDSSTLYFHLWRENLVAQAVSLYRAVETGHFHSNEPVLPLRPAYDPDRLCHWLTHIAGIENSNVRLLRRLNLPARLICYEEIIGNRSRVAELFAHALAVTFTPGEFEGSSRQDLAKLGDDWNSATEAQLRLDRPEVILRINEERLLKVGFGLNPHPPPPEAPEDLRAWTKGFQSGKAGRSPLNNPFDKDADNFEDWRAGWCRGWDTQRYAE